LAIFELLSAQPEIEYGNIVYFLFGNKNTKSKVYWHVESQLRKDAGLKEFLNNEVDITNCYELSYEEGKRTDILKTIDTLFQQNILSDIEKTILALSFNLSAMEEEREEGDLSLWTNKEIAVALKIPEHEVNRIRKRALNAIKPYLAKYANL
jgi:DNA-directed RNA polymerase specialized sigma subunit